MAGELTQSLLVYNAISASVTNTAAQPISMAGVRRATIFMTTSGGTWPNTTSLVEVSADGTNWVVYNKLITNVTNTNAQNVTRVATLSVASTTAMLTIDMTDDCFAYMRIFPTRTGGTMTMYLVREFYQT